MLLAQAGYEDELTSLLDQHKSIAFAPFADEKQQKESLAKIDYRISKVEYDFYAADGDALPRRGIRRGKTARSSD